VLWKLGQGEIQAEMGEEREEDERALSKKRGDQKDEDR